MQEPHIEKDDDKELTHKQELFARAYALHGNATQAAIDAGYTEVRESAQVISSRLMKTPEVREFIDEQKSIIAARHEINLDWNFKKLKAIVDIHSKTHVKGDTERMVDSRIVLSALDTISKQLGYYAPERHEHKVSEFKVDENIIKNFERDY